MRLIGVALGDKGMWWAKCILFLKLLNINLVKGVGNHKSFCLCFSPFPPFRFFPRPDDNPTPI